MMFVRLRPFSNGQGVFRAIGAAIACAGAIACSGGQSGGGSTSGPSGTGGTGGGSTASCRTGAAESRSVQTFVDGQVVSATTQCTVNAAGTQIVCQSSFTDSVGGPGTVTQTTRFASKSDIVDEAATNPPLSRSLGTETVTSTSGVSLTTTSTNAYDAQKRLTSTTLVNTAPLPTITTTFTAWDSSGRPTAGVSSGPGGGVITMSYDNTNRSVTRNIPPNTCTVTHDANGIIIKEVCTGTTGSTTDVTIVTTQTICK